MSIFVVNDTIAASIVSVIFFTITLSAIVVFVNVELLMSNDEPAFLNGVCKSLVLDDEYCIFLVVNVPPPDV